MYYSGQGVRQDNNKALEFYLKAANLGNVKAQHSAGIKQYRIRVLFGDLSFDRLHLQKWFGCGERLQ